VRPDEDSSATNRDGAARKGDESTPAWTVEVWEDDAGHSPFGSWFARLQEYDQAVVDAVIRHVVVRLGTDVCKTEWGKPLGRGLYEVRIRRSLNVVLGWGRSGDEEPDEAEGGDRTVLLRLFCTFYGSRIVLLFQGYDKGRDPSDKRQRREIAKARRFLEQWRDNRTSS
jgi:hypothetical protein